jgi:hypothetical protein
MLIARAANATTARVSRTFQRRRIEVAMYAARERVQRETPFSPSWDAAMAAFEELEREHWQVRSGATQAPPR